MPIQKERGLSKTTAAAAITLCFSTLVISVYAWLIQLGWWEDEYDAFAAYRQYGWGVLKWRLLHQKACPLSETLMVIYFKLSEALHAPGAIAALAVLWIVLAVSMVAEPIRRKSLGLLCVGTSMFALALAGHKVGEMYYWPMSSVVYMPVLAAVAVIFWALSSGVLTEGRKVAVCVALLVAETSSEMGAILAIVFPILVAVEYFLWQRKFVHHAGVRLANFLWLALPFAVALLLIWMSLHGRGANQEVVGDRAIGHHIVASVMASVPDFVVESISLDGAATAKSILLGALSKLLFVAGVFGIFKASAIARTRDTQSSYLLAFVVACAATCFLTILAAYNQFGMLCCERHSTLRQGITFVALAGIGAAMAQITKMRMPAYVAMSCILAATCIPVISISDDLIADLKRFGDLQQAAHENLRPVQGSEVKTLRLIPSVAGTAPSMDGHFTLDNAPLWLKGVMKYFHVHELEVTHQTK